jgi:hypothetical protein
MADMEASYYDHHAWDDPHEEGYPDLEDDAGEIETGNQEEADLSKGLAQVSAAGQ